MPNQKKRLNNQGEETQDSDVISSGDNLVATAPKNKPGRKDQKSEDDRKPSASAGVTINEEADDANLKDKSDKEKRNVERKRDVATTTVAPPKPVTERKSSKRRAKVTKPAKKLPRSSTSLGATTNSSRQINNKTFNRRQGVWYDSAYKGQKTTNVKRGTTQYNKLEPGLRSIGNQLKGTVVVVWKSRAYKIQ